MIEIIFYKQGNNFQIEIIALFIKYKRTRAAVFLSRLSQAVTLCFFLFSCSRRGCTGSCRFFESQQLRSTIKATGELFTYLLYVRSMADVACAHSFVDNPTVY